MSVKIVRLRNGEDIIAEIKEVTSKETDQVAALQFEDPFSIGLQNDTADMFVDGTVEIDGQDEPIKMHKPKVHMLSWIPLSASRTVYVEPSEVVMAYDPHPTVLDQYNRILEVINGNGNTSSGGRVDGVIDDTLRAPDQTDFVEATGSVPDWEGN
jgi:hypothetical protein